jgi:sec-independent protein translocase protein TatA
MFEGIFQPMHLLIILVIALIVFGPGKLPELGRGLGKSIREFKNAMSGDKNDSAKEVHKEIPLKDTIETSKEDSSQDTVKGMKAPAAQNTPKPKR